MLPSQEKIKTWSVTGTVQIKMRGKKPSIAYSIVLAQNTPLRIGNYLAFPLPRKQCAGSPLTELK